MMGSASVAAVVVTRNRRELLLQCLHALLRQSIPADIWVIDNASTDGTAEAVAALANSRVIYRGTGENLGGAGGFSFGIRAAAAQPYELLWLMDDDTIPEPTALERLLHAHERLRGSYGWLSSRALAPDGTDQPMNRQRATMYRDIAGYQANLIPAVMASFVSLIVPVEMVRRFGLPIGEFFIWSDDWEFTRRLSRQCPCYVVPDSRVIHAMEHPGVVNLATDAPERWDRYRWFYRNDVVLYRREGLRGWIWLLAKDLWHSAQVLWDRRDHRLKRIAVIWRGFAAGVRFHPSIEFLP